MSILRLDRLPLRLPSSGGALAFNGFLGLRCWTAIAALPLETSCSTGTLTLLLDRLVLGAILLRLPPLLVEALLAPLGTRTLATGTAAPSLLATGTAGAALPGR